MLKSPAQRRKRVALRADNENSFGWRARFALVIDIQKSRFTFYPVSVSSTAVNDTSARLLDNLEVSYLNPYWEIIKFFF